MTGNKFIIRDNEYINSEEGEFICEFHMDPCEFKIALARVDLVSVMKAIKEYLERDDGQTDFESKKEP